MSVFLGRTLPKWLFRKRIKRKISGGKSFSNIKYIRYSSLNVGIDWPTVLLSEEVIRFSTSPLRAWSSKSGGWNTLHFFRIWISFSTISELFLYSVSTFCVQLLFPLLDSKRQPNKNNRFSWHPRSFSQDNATSCRCVWIKQQKQQMQK